MKYGAMPDYIERRILFGNPASPKLETSFDTRVCLLGSSCRKKFFSTKISQFSQELYSVDKNKWMKGWRKELE